MRHLGLGLSFVMALLASARDGRAAGRGFVAEPRQGDKIRIDGDLREWPAKMTALAESREGASIDARAVIGYDDANVYLALRVGDKRIARTAQGNDTEDHATLTLAFPRGHGEYATYPVAIFPGSPGRLPALVKLGGKSVSGAKAVENAGAKELLLEAQIPWATFAEAAKLRVGLRAAVSYTNADVPGSVKGVVSTASGKGPRGLGALLLESEQGLADLLRDKGLSDMPSREAFGNVSGDATVERVAVFGHYLTISGSRFRAGKEFYFADLAVSGADMVQKLKLADFDGDGRQEIVVVKRVGSAEKYREVLEVTRIGREDSPFVAFSHEVGVKTPDGSISNKVHIDDSGIEVAQGDADGFEPDSYNEPLPGGNTLSALFPWESVASRTFKWQGNAFVKASEVKQTPKLSKSNVQKVGPSSDESSPPPPPAPSADELLDRVYALYKKDRGVSGGKPRFDFVADVAGDGAPERVLIHDKDVVVFGKGFRAGTSYSFITVGVSDPKDIRDATARDLTGDGKAEIIVRAVMRAKASKELGGETIDRHAVLVYSISGDKLVRVFAAETGRSLGKNQVMGQLAFVPAGKAVRIELRAGRAVGWTESSYPFPQDTLPAGGLEPLILPWTGGKRIYRFTGSAFARE